MHAPLVSTVWTRAKHDIVKFNDNGHSWIIGRLTWIKEWGCPRQGSVHMLSLPLIVLKFSKVCEEADLVTWLSVKDPGSQGPSLNRILVVSCALIVFLHNHDWRSGCCCSKCITSVTSAVRRFLVCGKVILPRWSLVVIFSHPCRGLLHFHYHYC